MDLIFSFFTFGRNKISPEFLGKDPSRKTRAASGTNARSPRDLSAYFESNRFYEWLEIKPAHNCANGKEETKQTNKMSNALWEADYRCLDTLARNSN